MTFLDVYKRQGIRQATAKSPVMDTPANIIGKALTMTPIMSGINADGTWGYGINGTNPIAMVPVSYTHLNLRQLSQDKKKF